jgi:hypothetical protein
MLWNGAILLEIAAILGQQFIQECGDDPALPTFR